MIADHLERLQVISDHRDASTERMALFEYSYAICITCVQLVKRNYLRERSTTRWFLRNRRVRLVTTITFNVTRCPVVHVSPIRCLSIRFIAEKADLMTSVSDHNNNTPLSMDGWPKSLQYPQHVVIRHRVLTPDENWDKIDAAVGAGIICPHQYKWKTASVGNKLR